jgi:hypothetical protein
MWTKWSGATGRYRASCGDGHCALTGGQATSKLQGQIFTLLDYVIGPGHYDKRSFAYRPIRPDMVFHAPNGRALVVEYDGAYWHRGQEAKDFDKALMVEHAWANQGCVVIRIREDPLVPLRPVDMQVPRSGNAVTCTRLLLLHLLHVMPGDFGDSYGDGKVENFLRCSSQPLARGDVRCETCECVAETYMPIELFPRPASPF